MKPLTFFVVIICSIAFARFGYAGDPIPFPSTKPMTVIPSTGQPSFVYPSQSPSGPAVILTPNSSPIYVHPPTSPYGPATIITPNSGPVYVWPSEPR